MQDLTHYTRDYYERDIPETWFWRRGLLRPDQLAAICYAYGQPFTGQDLNEPRDPGVIVSIGAGRGELEAAFERMGETVIGVDPSPGPFEMYEGRTLVSEASDAELAAAGTVVFCESVEHLPPEQTLSILQALSSGTRVIVVNWHDYFPLEPSDDGWDHITRVDHDFYVRLASFGRVVVWNGSHLVFDVEGLNE
jgi:hypothetical protein